MVIDTIQCQAESHCVHCGDCGDSSFCITPYDHPDHIRPSWVIRKGSIVCLTYKEPTND